MNLKLEAIRTDENANKAIFASTDCQNLLKMWADYYPKIGYTPPYIGYFIKDNNTVVGSCALIKNPNAEELEISYWTFEKYQGRGIASWACGKLLQIALKENNKIRILAKTEPQENTSTGVLKRNNFKFEKVVEDHEISDAWQWDYLKVPAANTA